MVLRVLYTDPHRLEWLWTWTKINIISTDCFFIIINKIYIYQSTNAIIFRDFSHQYEQRPRDSGKKERGDDRQHTKCIFD